MTYSDNSPLEGYAMWFIIGIISLFTCLYLILLIIYTPAIRHQNNLRDELFAARTLIGNSGLNNRNLLHPDSLDMSLNRNFDLWRSSDEDVDVLSSSSARTASTFSSDYTSSEDSVLSNSDELWDYTPPHTPVDNFTSSSFHDDSSSLEDWPRACTRYQAYKCTFTII
ncbi:hypothetical protein THOM_0180 [Trachipleistophora hominis]|uniref:Uncharacterized protein n=1 Tax=Trachipleistophora hominis TaxID=72359 RepID=L7K0A0_TRAHO|nr:hypothetical protein THOM_0180 [Trachipleistophora hominis]